MVPHGLHFLREGVRHVTLGGADWLGTLWQGRMGGFAADLFNEA